MFKSLIITFLIISLSYAKEEVKLTAKLKNIVWAIEFIDADNILATLKTGEIAFVNIKTNKIKYQKFPLELNDDAQGGLLDVALDPDFVKNKMVYFTYSKVVAKDKYATSIAKGIYEKDKVKDIKDIFVPNYTSKTPAHYGSRITFDDQGFLYFSVGDRYHHRDLAQDTSKEIGKILRINKDGSIPSDNPFKNAVWSYGHRNPQGLKWIEKNKTLLAIEHGPRGGDEINIIAKGKNYGWPRVSHGMEYDKEKAVGVKHLEDMVDPIKVYVPSIAPCGFDIKGNKLYIGALALTHLNVVEMDKNLTPVSEKRLLEKKEWRIRDVKVFNDNVYFSNDDGEIYQLIE